MYIPVGNTAPFGVSPGPQPGGQSGNCPSWKFSKTCLVVK